MSEKRHCPSLTNTTNTESTTNTTDTVHTYMQLQLQIHTKSYKEGKNIQILHILQIITTNTNII